MIYLSEISSIGFSDTLISNSKTVFNSDIRLARYDLDLYQFGKFAVLANWVK